MEQSKKNKQIGKPRAKRSDYVWVALRCLVLFLLGISIVLPAVSASAAAPSSPSYQSNLLVFDSASAATPPGCNPDTTDCGMGFLPRGTDLAKSILELVRVLAVAGSLYFFGGIVINLVQAQVAQGFGDRQGYAHSMEAVLAMVLLLSVAGATYPIADSLKSGFLTAAGNHNDVNGVIMFWQSLARVVVSFMLGTAVMTMMVKVAFSGASAQFGQLIGAPNAVASAAMNIAAAVGGGLLTLLSVWLANTLITRIVGG